MNINEVLHDVRQASRRLALLDEEQINKVLLAVADAAVKHSREILEANREDLQRMDPANPKYDRLKLTEERLEGIASDMRNVAALPSPLGRILEETFVRTGCI